MASPPSFSAGDGYGGNGHAGDASQGSGHANALYDEPAGPGAGGGVARLRALIEMLWANAWIIVGVFAVVVGAVGLYTYSMEPTYETSSLLLVDQENGASVVPSLTGSSSSGSSMFGRQGRNLSNEVLVLNQSETLAMNVAHRLDTMAVHPRTGERLAVLYDEAGNRRPQGSIAGIVGRRSSAQIAGQNVDAIQITTRSSSPAEAALIADQYAEAYIARTREKSRESIRAQRDFLEQQESKFQKRVNEAEQQLADYMQEKNTVSLDQESSRIVQQLSELEARRDEMRIELGMAESTLETKKNELQRIRPRLAERLSSGLQTELSRVQQEKANVEAAINQAKTRNSNLTASDTGPRAQNLRQLQRRAKRLERQADSLASAYVDQTLAAGGIGSGSSGSSGGGSGQGGGRDLSYVVQLQRSIAEQEIRVNGLEAQISTVERRIDEYQTRMENLPPQSLELAQLQRERRSVEQIYGYVRQQLQEVRMAEESEVGYAEVVRTAGIPVDPVAPNTTRNMTLGSLLGLLLGGGLVVLREKLDTRIRAPEDLQALGTRVIGVVPSMESLMEGEFGGDEEVVIDGQTLRASMVMLTSPMSAAAEAYRRLRANLRFARPDDEVRSMVVTSAAKGEGKTTTATNLALAMATAGQKTLLIDGDLRKSRLHRFFDLPKTPGLTEALYESPDLDAMETDIDNLSVIPAGTEVPNPAEVLGSHRMSRLITQMEDVYDIVIIDAPPVLLFSDPSSIIPHTDGALLVASANMTDAGAFEHALSLLNDIRSEHVGAVLNRFKPNQQRYGYGYGSGYGYGYGYGYQYSGYGYQYDEENLKAYYDDRTNGHSSVSSRVRSWWNGG